MPINHTAFKINYELTFDSLYPLEASYLKEQDGIFKCKLTWTEAKARPRLLTLLGKHAKKIGKIIWFQAEDPYKRSKPFEIAWIGLEGRVEEETEDTLILVVDGQKSERIEKKWTIKLSQFFGYHVNIIWEEDAQ